MKKLIYISHAIFDIFGRCREVKRLGTCEKTCDAEKKIGVEKARAVVIFLSCFVKKIYA